MRSRAKSGLLVAALISALIGTSVRFAAFAESPDDVCNTQDPARAIHLALEDKGFQERVAIARVVALEDGNVKTGTRVKVEEVLRGKLPLGETLADHQPTISCLSEGIWTKGRSVVGVFLPVEDGIWTLAAWPFEENKVQLTSDQAVTVTELLEMGEAYVEPTPTPLPKDVPPPPTLMPVDTGAQDQLEPPTTGQSSAGDSLNVWLLPLLGIAGLVAATGCWVYLRKAR